MNHQIRVPEIMLIDEHGTRVGTIPTQEALRLADERGLDLLEVAATAHPPVCRLVDIGKYLYEKEKTDRKQRTQQKRVGVKGIRLGLKIGKHDQEVRRLQTEKFLQQGHRVRIEMLLRGREKGHADLAKNIIESFIAHIEEDTIVEQPFTWQGGKIIILITKNTKQHAKNKNS